MQLARIHLKIAAYGLTLLFFTALPADAAVLLKVPFTSQAPSGDWRQPFQDFCEEASVVMAAHFLWGVGLTPEIAELEMRIIQSYEALVFGRSKDTSIDEALQSSGCSTDSSRLKLWL